MALILSSQVSQARESDRDCKNRYCVSLTIKDKKKFVKLQEESLDAAAVHDIDPLFYHT